MDHNKPTTLSKEFATRRTPKADASNLVFGKLPPQAKDLEQAILGALMLDKEAVTSVIEVFNSPTVFYLEAHQIIYSAIVSLFDKSEPIDILTVTEKLKEEGKLQEVGGPFYISELTNRVASSANIEYHARIVAQKYIQRELIRLSTTVLRDAYEDTTDVFNLLDETEQKLFEISDQNIGGEIKTMDNILAEQIKVIHDLKDKTDGLTGVPSGLTALDRLTSGWQPADLVIIAARPSMGKTALVLSFCRNAAVMYKRGVAIFSLEMSAGQLVQRLISAETQLPGDRLRKGQLKEHEFVQLTQKVAPLNDAPIFIDDTPAISINDLRAKCRRLKSQHDIQMIVIDYLQLMSGSSSDKGNREQEISNISRSLKKLGRELKVPVIALSQLNRSVETRGGEKKPMLSDLRESGAIEQDADMVMFIYRPEYYGIHQDENGNDNAGMADLIVAKHRNGPVETVRVRFENQYAKFSDVEDNFDFGNMENNDANYGKINPNYITMPSKMDDNKNIPPQQPMGDDAPF